MHFSSSLTLADVKAVFHKEIEARGGQVADTFDDGRRLFTRAVLPRVKEVRSGDGVQGGVALRGTVKRVRLYPYIFRRVCKNGAIISERLGPGSAVDLHQLERDTALQCIRQSIEACCAPEVFTNTVRKMRTATEVRADLALDLLPLVWRSFRWGHVDLVSQIMQRFLHEEDESRFGLANAVTALARDTRDPELRWELEKVGGGIAIGVVASRRVRNARKARDGAALPRGIVR